MGAEHREKAPWAPAALWNSGDTWAELPGALISGFQLCIWVDTPSLPSLSLLSLLSPHGGQPGRPRTSHLLWSHRGCLRALLDHWENPCVTDFWLLSAPHGFLSPLFTLSLMPFISPVLCSPMFSLTLLLLGCNLQFKVVMRSRAYFSHLPHTVGLINVSPNKILTSLHTCFLSRGDRGCGQERLVRTGSHSSSLLLSPYCLTHLSGNWRPQSLVLKYPFKNQHISWNIGFLVSFGIFFVVVVLFYFIFVSLLFFVSLECLVLLTLLWLLYWAINVCIQNSVGSLLYRGISPLSSWNGQLKFDTRASWGKVTEGYLVFSSWSTFISSVLVFATSSALSGRLDPSFWIISRKNHCFQECLVYNPWMTYIHKPYVWSIHFYISRN